MNRKKIEKAIERIEKDEALWAPYIDGTYTVSFGWTRDWSTGKKVYYAAYHKGAMPPFNSSVFASAEELAKAILKLQPDMRRWRVAS